MKNCAFTIVAKNYIGLAKILQGSIEQHNPEIDFFIVVADEFNSECCIPENVIIGREQLYIPVESWVNMSFKYDLTEFCTAIKPFSFSYFFRKGYDKVIYFDPDIYVFSQLNPIISLLDDHSAVLTPQINGIHVKYNGELPEYAMNLNGIFNMGFCALKNTTKIVHFVKWWEERLRTKCFAERSMGYFTDQKWIDWLPGFLESEQLCVSRELGMNLAPWNFFERKVIEENGTFFVKYRDKENEDRKDKLIFMHFAGYDYNCFKQGIIKRKRINNLNDYMDLRVVQTVYKDAIVAQKDTFDMYISLKYSYNTFDNGCAIDKMHRRIYDSLIDDGFYISNPFSTARNSFYAELKRKGLICKSDRVDKINKSNISDYTGLKKKINKLYSLLFKIVGYKKYVLLIRSHIMYSNMNEHSFIVNKSNIHN